MAENNDCKVILLEKARNLGALMEVLSEYPRDYDVEAALTYNGEALILWPPIHDEINPQSARP